MFFSNDKMGFIITGVFFVNYSVETVREKGRHHSAMSFRIKGNSTFLCDEKECFLDSGSVIYIPKGVDYVRKTNSPEALISIHFDTFGDDESDIQISNGKNDLRPFFETIYKYWCLKEYNKCIQTVYKVFDILKDSDPGKISFIPAVIAEGVKYIESNFRSPQASIADAAKLCHISEAYFRRLYRSHFGRSPLTTLLELRFNFAKSLLRSGYYEIKQVAAFSGFSDPKYFRTAFRKRFGITPTQYAIEHQEE